MKVCKTCKERKNVSDFHKTYASCKECRNHKIRERYARDLEFKDYRRKKKRYYKEQNPKVSKNREIKNNFGITLNDYDAILQKQDFGCAICKKNNPGRVGSNYFSVDHCHVTGKIRGLLCQNCNLALGLADDDPKILIGAIGYLSQHRENE